MKFTPRVTMRAVAAAAGVHQTTVSLALRHDRRIPETTRQRIAAVAEQLGYTPHPLVSAYAAACRASRKPSATAGTVLACLLPGGKCDRDTVAGARTAAAAQGYTLETFAIGNRITPARVNTILQTRNIHGLIIGSMPEAAGSFELDWGRFCAVTIEYTFASPKLDRVVHDSYSGMQATLAQCGQRGLRRVGLVLTRNGHARTLGLNDAAFWQRQKAAGSKLAAIAPLHLGEWDAAAFERWFRRFKPQAVISSATLIHSINTFFAGRGLRVPQDVSLLSLNVSKGEGFSGIDQNFPALGATAARMVIDKLVRNDRGTPQVRQTVLIPGRWVEGETLGVTAE